MARGSLIVLVFGGNSRYFGKVGRLSCCIIINRDFRLFILSKLFYHVLQIIIAKLFSFLLRQRMIDILLRIIIMLFFFLFGFYPGGILLGYFNCVFLSPVWFYKTYLLFFFSFKLSLSLFYADRLVKLT